MNSKQYFKILRKEIARVKKHPLSKSAQNIVIGEGNLNAKLIIVGQNPGAEEDKTGKPFVGRAGKYLNKILEKNKIKRKNIYITNVVNFKTPENREPDEKEIKFFMPLLVKQIETIKPKVVVLLGKIAWQVPDIKGIKFVRIYHPSAAMRFTKFRNKFEADFAKLKKMI